MLKNILALIAIPCLILCANAKAEDRAEEKVDEGLLLCSTVRPNAAGFSLIRTRNVDREFSGQYDLGELRVLGRYNPKTTRLMLTVNRVDENWETADQWFSAELRLSAGSFTRLKFLVMQNEKPVEVELVCNYNGSVAN